MDVAVAICVFTTYGPEDDDLTAHGTGDLNVTFADPVEGSDLFAEGRNARWARRLGHGRAVWLGGA